MRKVVIFALLCVLLLILGCEEGCEETKEKGLDIISKVVDCDKIKDPVKQAHCWQRKALKERKGGGGGDYCRMIDIPSVKDVEFSVFEKTNAAKSKCYHEMALLTGDPDECIHVKSWGGYHPDLCRYRVAEKMVDIVSCKHMQSSVSVFGGNIYDRQRCVDDLKARVEGDDCIRENGNVHVGCVMTQAIVQQDPDICHEKIETSDMIVQDFFFSKDDKGLIVDDIAKSCANVAKKYSVEKILER